jgi:hypothetical protein
MQHVCNSRKGIIEEEYVPHRRYGRGVCSESIDRTYLLDGCIQLLLSTNLRELKSPFFG